MKMPSDRTPILSPEFDSLRGKLEKILRIDERLMVNLTIRSYTHSVNGMEMVAVDRDWSQLIGDRWSEPMRFQTIAIFPLMELTGEKQDDGRPHDRS